MPRSSITSVTTRSHRRHSQFILTVGEGDEARAVSRTTDACGCLAEVCLCGGDEPPLIGSCARHAAAEELARGLVLVARDDAPNAEAASDLPDRAPWPDDGSTEEARTLLDRMSRGTEAMGSQPRGLFHGGEDLGVSPMRSECSCHDPTCRWCPCRACAPEHRNTLARHRGSSCPCCGTELTSVLDGEAWCSACQRYV